MINLLDHYDTASGREVTSVSVIIHSRLFNKSVTNRGTLWQKKLELQYLATSNCLIGHWCTGEKDNLLFIIDTQNLDFNILFRLTLKSIWAVHLEALYWFNTMNRINILYSKKIIFGKVLFASSIKCNLYRILFIRGPGLYVHKCIGCRGNSLVARVTATAVIFVMEFFMLSVSCAMAKC